jgi:hypothetical protein
LLASNLKSNPSSPWHPRGFYFFNHLKALNEYLPIPGTIFACSLPTVTHFYAPKNFNFFDSQQSRLCPPLNYTDIFIPSPQSLNTSFIVAVKDAIGPPESHCRLVPIIWNLMEAKIRRKGLMYLPC